MSLRQYTTEELLAELRRREHPYGCTCGPARREIVERSMGFHPRTGCLNCDRWDEPPRLVKP